MIFLLSLSRRLREARVSLTRLIWAFAGAIGARAFHSAEQVPPVGSMAWKRQKLACRGCSWRWHRTSRHREGLPSTPFTTLDLPDSLGPNEIDNVTFGTVDPTVIPLPAGLALLLTGLGAMALLRRRRA
ncbi:MAG: VPLPA-CTERM sorting domain-containing protein [Pseudomonadota bacterium]